MGFDLARIKDELAAEPLASPYPLDLAAAIVSDRFRMADAAPPPDDWWRPQPRAGLWPEQIGMVAHILAVTSLGVETVTAVKSGTNARRALDGFRKSIAPLTGEMIRANAFRQEECLRKWIVAVGGTVDGETAAESRRRLAQLDYGTAMKEYAKAEKSRLVETARREKLLKEALEREAAARGWRE